MQKSRLERLSPLTGLISVGLLLVGVVVFNNYDYLPSPEKVANFLNDNATQVTAGAYIALLATFFLIWFTGSVRSVLVEHEGGTGMFSSIAFGAGIAAAITLGISFVAMYASGLRASAAGGISPVGAVMMFDFWGQVTGQLFAICMAAFVAATATVSLRTALFPSWFSWVSLLIALGLLTPFAYIVLAFGLVWLVMVSIWLYLKG